MFLVRKIGGGQDNGKLYAMKVLKKASIVQKAKTTEHIRTERQVLASVRQSPFPGHALLRLSDRRQAPSHSGVHSRRRVVHASVQARNTSRSRRCASTLPRSSVLWSTCTPLGSSIATSSLRTSCSIRTDTFVCAISASPRSSSTMAMATREPIRFVAPLNIWHPS